MKRREFLKGTLAAGTVATVPARAATQSSKRQGNAVKDLGAGVYAGRRYEALVPDTLDLAKRAELAISGIGGTIDPGPNRDMFFLVRYTCKTPYMAHHAADSTCDTFFGESFPMLRTMCGSDHYADVETAQRAALVSRIRGDLYWNFFDPTRPWQTSYRPNFDGEAKNEDLANVAANARMLRALLAWREVSGNPDWDQTIRQLVRGLKRIAIRRGDYSYYPDGGFGEPFNYPRSGWVKTDEPTSETEGGEGSVVAYHGHQIQALTRWYAVSGDAEALDLAARVARFCMLPKFWGGLPNPEGEIGALAWIRKPLPGAAGVAHSEMGHWYSHFHARAVALRGLLEYGMTAGNQRVLEFVRRAYEYSWTLGIPRMGWVNCHPATANLCEGCALGDMVAMGIRLSDAGMGDYWDDVDAVARNHLVEQQFTDAERLEKVSAAAQECDRKKEAPHEGQVDTRDVIKRSLGNFAGASAPDSIPNPWVMQCCTGNGTQGLYYAWEGIVRQSGDSAQVNLLLNRPAEGLDVDSYLPYEGKVVIHNKKMERVSIRIPSWVLRKEIRSRISGKEGRGVWVGNYLMFDGLRPGDQVELNFPVPQTTARYTANSRTEKEQTYTCTFRGSTLVDISPRDDSPTSYPLYLRDHLKRDKAPLKKMARFVPDRTILRW